MTSTGEAVSLYKPFPSFAEWSAADVSTEAFDRYSASFLQIKQTVTPEQLDRVRTIAVRTAAVDTNAIEGVFTTERGFTRTVATKAAQWEAAMEAKGARARRAFEDSLAGYEVVLDVVTTNRPITETWVRDLHATLLASQDTYDVFTPVGMQARTLPKGEYKKYPNSPSLPGGATHSYAPVEDTGPEMHRFIEELRSPEFRSAHPVLQASYAHYAFVSIHPFSDGNGRVSRALASVFLYRDPGVPFVVFDDQKNEYFDALQAADEGDPTAFIQFVSARAVDTVAELTTRLKGAVPSAAESLADLAAVVDGGGVGEDLEPVALRLKELVVTELRARLSLLDVPEVFDVKVSSHGLQSVRLGRGFRSIGREGGVFTSVTGFSPVDVVLVRAIEVGVRADASAPSDLILIDVTGFATEFSRSDIEPAETASVRHRVRTWAEVFWDRMFADVRAQHFSRSAG